MKLCKKTYIRPHRLILALGLITSHLLLFGCKDSFQEGELTTDFQAISFGAQSFSAIGTRAGNSGGKTGIIDLSVLKGSNCGFGVFATYSGTSHYSSDLKADFMWNQDVSWDTSNSQWDYSPVKYWPNYTLPTPTSEKEVMQFLSFFSYAPFVSDVSTATSGITDMTPNNEAGDPRIRYKTVYNPEEGVDLLWGVRGTDGLAHTNHARPSVNYRVDFHFQHSLFMLNLLVRGEFDRDKLPLQDVDSQTRILLNSIHLEGGFFDDAWLNLNNTTPFTPRWENGNGTGLQLNYVCSPSSSPMLINPAIRGFSPDEQEAQSAIGNYIREGGTFEDLPSGITSATSKVGSSTSNGLMLIPLPTDPNTYPLRATVNYTVITKDAQLASDLSSNPAQLSNTPEGFFIFNNEVSELLDLSSMDIVAGKQYSICFVLGMNSVKFEVEEVVDWTLPYAYYPVVPGWDETVTALGLSASSSGISPRHGGHSEISTRSAFANSTNFCDYYTTVGLKGYAKGHASNIIPSDPHLRRHGTNNYCYSHHKWEQFAGYEHLRFYSYAPRYDAPDDDDSGENPYTTLDQTSGLESGFTIDDDGSWQTGPTIHLTVPEEVSKQRDILFAVSADYDGTSNAPGVITLPFRHLCTSVRFAVGDIPAGYKIEEITLSGIKNKDSYNFRCDDTGKELSSSGWNATYNESGYDGNSNSTYTFEPHILVTDDSSVNGSTVTLDGTIYTRLTKNKIILPNQYSMYLVPQTLTGGAKLRMKVKDTNNTIVNYEIDLSGTGSWQQGTSVIYKINLE